jgi:methylated-DNA-[protein]-cysteine S-methyltransferase
MSATVKRPVGITTCQTAFGWVGIAWSHQGLVSITLPSSLEADALEQLPPPARTIPDTPRGLDLSGLVGKLQRYFEGQKAVFGEPLDPSIGTGFQRRVWQLTRDIPRGQTRTYGQIARLAGSPGAARAVGQAMARNPRPIIVPCHRVLGSDGGLTGFGGGVDMKRRMLQLEGAAVLTQPLFGDFKLDAHA